MLYPLIFQPLLKERVWGGRNLDRLYKKPLPPGKPIGESWEISDRPGDESVIANGPLAGKSLHWLMENHREELLGKASAPHGRFPLLIKILDAQEKLSLQVHPPARFAAQFGGEPKTEMWYIAHAAPGAELYVGLTRQTSSEIFKEKLENGTVSDCFHRIPVQPGDAMFVPSGRVHAIGAGSVLFEIQQNSDTTFRVFDWNRVGLDGQSRPLHISESLQCIDFNDFEPGLIHVPVSGPPGNQIRQLVSDPLFQVEERRCKAGTRISCQLETAEILAILSGAIRISHAAGTLELHPGDFCLLPACLESARIEVLNPSIFLCTRAG